MANILTLLRDIYKDKKSDIENRHWSRCEEIEKRLAKTNPQHRELTNRIQKKEEQRNKLREEINKAEQLKKKLFPEHWDAKRKATELLEEDYLNLRLKATVTGIPKEQIKTMVEDFHRRDYLAVVMGA